MTNKNYTDRKPDMDTESFRAWTLDKKEQDESKKEFEEKGFKVKYKEMEISLTGFTITTDKKTKKLIMAYKFKHDKKDFLYFIPDEKEEELKEMIKEMEKVVNAFGYNFTNMKEILENIYLQKDILEKMQKEKEKGQKSKNDEPKAD